MTSPPGARSCALVVSDPFVPVARVSELVPGHPRTVTVDGREIAVFNVDGRFYAIENCCPHQGAPLAGGWLRGTTITCPWHGWCFNLTDGEMPLGRFATVDTFDVHVVGETLYVNPSPRPPARS